MHSVYLGYLDGDMNWISWIFNCRTHCTAESYGRKRVASSADVEVYNNAIVVYSLHPALFPSMQSSNTEHTHMIALCVCGTLVSVGHVSITLIGQARFESFCWRMCGYRRKSSSTN